MLKPIISTALRKLKLIYLMDFVRFEFEKIKHKKVNLAFKKNNPTVILPPDYLIYESFQMNYDKYYFDGKESAKWVFDYVGKYIELKNKKILDWGCGPARVIRHLPEVIGANCEFYGTDYNKNSIDWCTKNLPNLKFNLNPLEAKLPYSTDFFDVIYGISIFTHLSEQLHYDWYAELYRILKPNGILFITCHGNNFREKLITSEQKIYDSGSLVVRGKVKEGHRTFAAFQPKEFMLKLFKNAQILEHIETRPTTYLPQDIWVVRKG